MTKLLSCHYNMDTNRVEARFEDGTTLAIDCIAVEDEYGNTSAQRAELDWLLYNKPLEYAQMVLRGEMEHYLSLGCDHGRLDEPQKTRGKTANRAARIFIADFYSGNIARVYSSVRSHFSEIQSYYSLFLQVSTFTSHLPTHEECTPVQSLFAVYSRSAGFIRALFARLSVFSVNSA